MAFFLAPQHSKGWQCRPLGERHQALPGHRVGAKLSIQGNPSGCLALRVGFSRAADKLGEGVKLICVRVGGIARGQRTFATGDTLHHGSMSALRANVIMEKMLR